MPIEEKEKLFLNTLSFEYPKEPVTFYFSLEDRTDCRLTKLNHLLFPSNIKDIFPKISNSDTLYTSFDYKIDGLLPLEINFSANNFFIAKRYYNRQIKYYFNQKGILVEPTFIKDNQIWLQNKAEKAPKDCAIYDRYTIKVNFNHFFSSPELVVSFDRPSKVLTKSVSKFLSENDEATADLFNRVVYIEYFQNENGTRTTRRQVTKYEKLKEFEDVDYQNVYPIINRDLAAFIGIDDDEDEQETTVVFQKKNRYTKYYGKISRFYDTYLNNDDFRAIAPIDKKGFSFVNPMQMGKTTPQSKQLIFGRNQYGDYQTGVVPQKGVNYGPFKQPIYNNIQLFFIAPKLHFQHTVNLADYLLKNYKNYFKGLMHYTNVPVSLTPKGFSIQFLDLQNPLPEIEQALENRVLNPDVKYIAIYLTPIGKHAKDKEQRKIYFKVKEKLLNRNISSQCIETDKMMQVIAEDEKNNRKNFAYTLQNMAIAINAKLGGIPWRINTPISKELIVGVGAFKNIDTNIQYIGSAFSFDNSGAFNSFEYFHHDQVNVLAGSIENAIINFTKVNNKPSRLIIHFYKEMSEQEIEPIENILHRLNLDIPFFVVTINKTESEDFVLFDGKNVDLLPYSGRYINLGNQTFLLCNNTRYEDSIFSAIDGFPFPVKLKIHCPNDEALQTDRNIIEGLIDQVYQFSRIYWKSVKQQNLPVTIKYPGMVAQIAPHFSSGDIPSNIGKDNLWFL
ncbi:MAG TPA: hypothetical protein DC024_08215 [Clostridiales bacterium]|jgi:hypothetical protein|nr:hypothetical protein [Clostridiales bacterium]